MTEDRAAGTVVAILTAQGHPTRPYAVAFVSHVNRDLANRAAEAAADQVLPRSRFNTELPRILQTRCAPV